VLQHSSRYGRKKWPINFLSGVYGLEGKGMRWDVSSITLIAAFFASLLGMAVWMIDGWVMVVVI